MIRLAVRTPAESAEQVLAALLELAPSGVEQVDRGSEIEYAVYGAPGELPTLPQGEAVVGGVRVAVTGREVPDDWAERWKRFYSPILIGGALYVRPPWEEPAVRPGVHEIVIDPGQAFGTGTHPTTRMCLELMLELEPQGSFADLGCGSGVLAIAAAKLGFDPVTAVDADRAAVHATERNALANGVRLDLVQRADLRKTPAPAADVIAANLTSRLIRGVSERMLEVPRAMLVSGLLEGEMDAARRAFAALEERRRLVAQGWGALLLARR